MATPDRFKENRTAPAGALYVHVPFCVARCAYCDFYSRLVADDRPGRFVDAARRELELRTPAIRTPLDSVFVGGGTPTSLPPGELARLLGAVSPLTGPDTEFTVEANPGTLDPATLHVLVDAGVSRVSLGVQSFDDDELRTLGRIHDARSASDAIRACRQAGLDNLSLDLIYGVPGQTLRSWRRTLNEAIFVGVEHLSCYALSFENGTAMDDRRRAGELSEMDPETQRACYCTAVETAASAGLEQYEISNFARPRRRCRHNLTYWRNLPYVGIGPAAAGYVDGMRTTNAADIDAYLAALCDGRLPPADSERLTGRAAMGETLMLALRTCEGVSRKDFADRYGSDPADAFSGSIGRFAACDAVLVDATRIRIAPEHFFVADTILAEILSEA